ncbi:MAG: hypothetical protein KKA42_04855 [candidate division Zixibacteria bacterium]|nr:hypothetical protein [candidate division Zixibacteria bacterium]
MAKKKHRRKGASADYQENFWFRIGTKGALTLAVIVIFLTMVQCTVKKPEAPTWTTQFTVPLVSRTYTMSEIIEHIDQDGIQFDVDSNVIYTISRDLDTVTLDTDELTTADMSYSISEQLGIIDIDPPSVPPVSVSTIDLIGGLASGVGVPVPETTFAVARAIDPISNFSTATVASGRAYAVVDNSLGLDLSAASIELYDLVNLRSLGVQSFAGGLADGSVDSALFNLDGQTISNSLEARITGTTLDGDTLSTIAGSVTTQLNFQNGLSVSSGTAEIPAMVRTFSQPVVLDEPDPVYHATLTGGDLELDIANATNLDATLEITFPDLKNGGLPLTVIQPVAAASSQLVMVDLTGYVLSPADSTVPQDISVEIVATVPGTAPLQRAVDAADEFSATASLTGLAFGSVTGAFAAVTSTIDPRVETIDVPDGFEGFELVTAIVTLEIENAVNLPGTLDITLVGDNGKTMHLVRDVAAGGLDNPVVTIIDTVVSDFLTPLPSTITISGSAGFGDGGVGTILPDDYVFARMEITAPLEMIIAETNIETDIESEDLNQDDMETITDHVTEARFVYNVISHLPLGTQVSVWLGSDSATLATNPQVTLDPIVINAAPTVAGIVSDTLSTGYQTIVLDSADIQVLRSDTLYILNQLVLQGSDGLPVRLTNNDFVTVIGHIEVDYVFDGDF